MSYKKKSATQSKVHASSNLANMWQTQNVKWDTEFEFLKTGRSYGFLWMPIGCQGGNALNGEGAQHEWLPTGRTEKTQEEKTVRRGQQLEQSRETLAWMNKADPSALAYV